MMVDETPVAADGNWFEEQRRGGNETNMKGERRAAEDERQCSCGRKGDTGDRAIAKKHL